MEWRKYNPPPDAAAVLSASPQVVIASTIEELVDLACGGQGSDSFEVTYDVPGMGKVVEANVVRVRNGVAANYVEPYMRRRDPDCMVIADNHATNKPRFVERFGYDFPAFRELTLDWLKTQPLAMFGFTAGQHRRDRWHEQRGSGLILAVCDRAAGRPGEPAAQAIPGP